MLESSIEFFELTFERSLSLSLSSGALIGIKFYSQIPPCLQNRNSLLVVMKTVISHDTEYAKKFEIRGKGVWSQLCPFLAL